MLYGSNLLHDELYMSDVSNFHLCYSINYYNIYVENVLRMFGHKFLPTLAPIESDSKTGFCSILLLFLECVQVGSYSSINQPMRAGFMVLVPH